MVLMIENMLVNHTDAPKRLLSISCVFFVISFVFVFYTGFLFDTLV